MDNCRNRFQYVASESAIMDLRVVGSRQAPLLGSLLPLCTYRYGLVVIMHDDDQAATEHRLAPVFARSPTPPGNSSIFSDLVILTKTREMLETTRIKAKTTRQLREVL